MSRDPLEPTAKSKIKDGCSQTPGLDPSENPLQLSLNLPKVFMILNETVARLSAADAPWHFRLSLRWQARVFEQSAGAERWPVVPDTTALVFQSPFANGISEQKKDAGSSSLKSSALSVCLFPFLKGHLHNSEQPALLAVTKENFEQA